MLSTLQTGILAVWASFCLVQQVHARNVLLIVVDDMGRDTRAYGNTYVQTPNLDQLSAGGVTFRNAFCTTASCSPSRSVLLTGLHNHANGQYGLAHAEHNFRSLRTTVSLPKLLADRGYRTGIVGKHHIEPAELYSFQTTLAGMQGGARNPVSMAERSREFIADKSAPFFLYYCTTDPHRSNSVLTNKPGQPNSFGNGASFRGVTEVPYDPGQIELPPFLPDTPAARAEWAEYCQSVSRVDQGVGRLMAILKETGQLDSTLVLFLSDNGPPFPGAKTTLYEGGMRLPLIVHAPGVATPGRMAEEMVSWLDITPTILDWAGGEVRPREEVGSELRPGADGSPSRRFHGRSFLELLSKPAKDGWDVVFGSHSFHEVTMYYPMRVIRTPTHKLILNLAWLLPFPFASDLHASATWQDVLREKRSHYGPWRVGDYLQRPKFELYDLVADPNESRNLAVNPTPGNAALMEGLAKRLREHQRATNDPWMVKYSYE